MHAAMPFHPDNDDLLEAEHPEGWLEERRFAIDACTMPAYSRIRRASKAVRFQGIAVGH
jgi:hypothetical protein